MTRKGIRYKGQSYESTRICGKNFALIERLSGVRERYKAFDPVAGPGGDLCTVQILENNRHVIRQLRLLKGIRNINVPSIRCFDVRGKRIYVVLSWFHGQPLSDYLDNVRRRHFAGPTPTEAFRLFRGLAHGVSNLNSKKGIVHGDIKPANLVLTKEPSGLALIDFGSSWHLEHGFKSQEVEGVTPQYGAPEFQVRDFELGMPGFHSDQFSTAIVLSELVTLKVPYESLGGAAGATEEMRRGFAGKLVSARQQSAYPDDLPFTLWKSIDRLLSRSLQFEPGQRFATPSAWLNAIDSIYDGIKKQGRLELWERTALDMAEMPLRILDSLRRKVQSLRR